MIITYEAAAAPVVATLLDFFREAAERAEWELRDGDAALGRWADDGGATSDLEA